LTNVCGKGIYKGGNFRKKELAEIAGIGTTKVIKRGGKKDHLTQKEYGEKVHREWDSIDWKKGKDNRLKGGGVVKNLLG